ncbi:MAG: Holliday junction branch migration protein RuvA [Succinivibrio sp.]
MIGSLRGTLLRIDGTTALIEAGGVGYEVEMPVTSLSAISPNAGKEVFVYVHHAVREDAQALYGFADPQSRSLFRTLIKVSGIGPKSALAALSTFDPAEFAQAIAEGRASSLTRIPGVGKKTAERMIVELRGSLKGFGAQDGAAQAAGGGADSAYEEAVAALVSLGFKEVLAEESVKAAYQKGMRAEEAIKAALAIISKGGR